METQTLAMFKLLEDGLTCCRCGSNRRSPSQLTVCLSVVAKQIALSTEGYRLLAQDIVSKAGFAHTVSTSWIRDMLKSQGFTVKKPTLVGRRLWADDEKAAISHRLALKMLWTMNTYKIPPTRVYNIDETAISLTLGIRKGWSKPGQQQRIYTKSSEKPGATVTLACCAAGPPVFAQIIVPRVYYTGVSSGSIP